MKKITLLLIACILLLGISACKVNTEDQTPTVIDEVVLTPYYTATPTPGPTSTPPDARTVTPLPTSTPTPRVYEVKANDTLIVIAFKNGLTLDELLAANPDVNPYSLSIGTKLMIPAVKVESGTKVIPTPTPVPVTVGEPICYQNITGGLDCFALAENREDYVLENLTAEFRLTNPETGDVLPRSVFLPLSRLDVGASLPFYAYFPPPVFDHPVVSLQLLSASGSSMTIAASYSLVIEEPSITLVSNDKSATAEGVASLGGKDVKANNIHIVAVAYDEMDRVVGVRFYEEKSVLKSGDDFRYRITVYSVGGKIKRVEVFGEALP